MLRYYEFEPAFWAAMAIALDGKKTVNAEDFVREMAKVNWFWMPHLANKRIESTMTISVIHV